MTLGEKEHEERRQEGMVSIRLSCWARLLHVFIATVELTLSHGYREGENQEDKRLADELRGGPPLVQQEGLFRGMEEVGRIY
ncbi:hypothetical protein KM043_003551 [Ampulex compressa]|nr:hypothetical protein KM043_003551 [Ampulex compressa]